MTLPAGILIPSHPPVQHNSPAKPNHTIRIVASKTQEKIKQRISETVWDVRCGEFEIKFDRSSRIGRYVSLWTVAV